MSKDIIHVIVGAGNASYFINAIRSVVRANAGDVFAAYNFVDGQDLVELEARKGEISDAVRLEIRQNDPSLRTGSLYEANNSGLRFARDKYDFVSFFQADMQLMWWNPEILNRARQIIMGIGGESQVSFYTQLPVLGKHPEPYKHWRRSAESQAYFTFGHVDVSLLPIYAGLNKDFAFVGTERSMARDYASAKVFFHPYPYIAAIPFPVNVRQPIRVAREGRDFDNSPILVARDSYTPNFESIELHPISMEQSVRPNGWSCLFPFWPSDTMSEEWVIRRVQYSRIAKQSLFASINSKGRLQRFTIWPTHPSMWKLLFSLLRLSAQKLLALNPKLLTAIGIKRISGQNYR